MTGEGPWFKDADFVYVSEKKAQDLRSNLAKPGDILFTQRGTLGQVALIPHGARYPEYVISQSQMRLTPALVPPLYIYIYFSDPRTVEHILANSTAAGVPHINLGFLRQLKLCVPSSSVANAFDTLTRPVLDQLLTNARDMQALSSLRDLLLPKLISGELRIPDAEKLAEAVL